jgi:hypothetical protein
VKSLDILKSKYCWLVIFISIFLGYFLIIKKFTSFTNFWSILLSVFYIILFAISNSCLIREIKERSKDSVRSGKSIILSILGTIFGFGAIQLCSISGGCGINIFTSLLFSILPTSLSLLVVQNGIWILLVSDLLLVFAIYKMRCFRIN